MAGPRKRIDALNREFMELVRAQDAARRPVTIPGVGVLNATALMAAIGDGSAFRRGRDLAAWLGLLPRQHTTGGKPKLLGISKRGNKYLRTLFVQGARAALPSLARSAAPLGHWLRGLLSRPASRQPGSKNGTRCRAFYKDRDVRISILAAGNSTRDRIRLSRPLKPPSKPSCSGAGHTFF